MKFMASIFIIMIKALRRKNKILKEKVKVLEEQLYMEYAQIGGLGRSIGRRNSCMGLFWANRKRILWI